MSYVAKDVIVDSSHMVIADLVVLGGKIPKGRRAPLGGEIQSIVGKGIKVPNGTYRCNWSLLPGSTDNKDFGPDHGTGTLKVKSGMVYVVDPAYVTGPDDWGKEKYPRGVVTLQVGSDGTYNVEFTLRRK